jgi:hypothetical protein
MATAQPQRDRETRDADSALRLLVRLLARAAAREAVSTTPAPQIDARSAQRLEDQSHD